MSRRNIPSWKIALAITLVATLTNAVMGIISGAEVWEILLENLIFSLILFALSLVILETFVYRRISHLTDRREKEIKRLRDLEAFRREFIGDVSHELKTPIFAIEGFIETLIDGAMEDPKVNRRFLRKALKHAERLSHLVQDILVITQVESGDLSMQMRPFSIYDLITETVDSLGNKLTKKDRDINCFIEANDLEDILVFGEEERIEQVLYNLLDNAVKYGDAQGTIKVCIENYGIDKIRIKVQDQGHGIEKNHLPRLFQRFYRVDKSRSREKGGTGLGLAICKHLIEAHQEKIWVESEVGKGTTFHFTLKKVEEPE